MKQCAVCFTQRFEFDTCTLYQIEAWLKTGMTESSSPEVKAGHKTYFHINAIMPFLVFGHIPRV